MLCSSQLRHFIRSSYNVHGQSAKQSMFKLFYNCICRRAQRIHIENKAAIKNSCCARNNSDPREGQQPFQPNPNGVGDRTTSLRRLLVGAD